MFNKRNVIGMGLAVLALAAPALAIGYYEIASWTTILAGAPGPTQNMAAVVEGNSSYHFLTGGNSPRLERLDNLGGAQTVTILTSSAQWSLAGGTNNPAMYYGMTVSGNYIQFADTATDGVWRINKSTGAISQYVTKAQIFAVAGNGGGAGTEAALLASARTAPDGEFVVYDSTSKSIIKTTGPGACQVYVTAADITAITGGTGVAGGLGFDATGAMYFGSSTSKALHKRDPISGVLSTVLTTAQIQAVAGGSSVSFKDIFFAPDGFMYFQDNSSGNILRFDPSNPVGTLANYITKAELTAGPMAGSNVIQLSWYNGGLAWHTFQSFGLYGVAPEPAALTLLAVAGLLLRRR